MFTTYSTVLQSGIKYSSLKKIPLQLSIGCFIGISSRGPVHEAQFCVLLLNVPNRNWSKGGSVQKCPSQRRVHTHSLSPRTRWALAGITAITPHSVAAHGCSQACSK